MLGIAVKTGIVLCTAFDDNDNNDDDKDDDSYMRGWQLPLCPSPTSFLNAIHTEIPIRELNEKSHRQSACSPLSYCSDCLICVVFFSLLSSSSTGICLYRCSYVSGENDDSCRRPLERQRQIKFCALAFSLPLSLSFSVQRAVGVEVFIPQQL